VEDVVRHARGGQEGLGAHGFGLASANNLVLAQRKVEEKSNEITAIPKLLNALELAGTVVPIDAMGCQREIASRIIEKEADYVLAVKENQPGLLADIKDSFQMLAADAVAEEVDCGHGRVERRNCSVVADLSLLERPFEWASLQALVRIESERYHKVSGKTEREIRYYIPSLKPDARQLNGAIRQCSLLGSFQFLSTCSLKKRSPNSRTEGFPADRVVN
jgi:predicted transposase YbfD/YdcC